MRCFAWPAIKLMTMSKRSIATTPTAEYRYVSKVFFFMLKYRNPILSSSMGAHDYAGCEKRKDDDRQEEKDVSRVDHTIFDALEMGYHAESCDRFDQPRRRPADKHTCDRRQAGENKKEQEDNGKYEAHYLVARHCRSHRADGKIGTRH